MPVGSYYSGTVDSSGRVFISRAVVSVFIDRIDPADGTPLWSTDVSDATHWGDVGVRDMSAAAGKVLGVFGSRVFGIGAVYKAVILDAEAGGVLGEYVFTGEYVENLAILGEDGEVYAFHSDGAGAGDLKRVSGTTWSVAVASDKAPTGLSYDQASNALYTYSPTRVTRYNAASGAEVWSVETTLDYPAYINTGLLVGLDGNVNVRLGEYIGDNGPVLKILSPGTGAAVGLYGLEKGTYWGTGPMFNYPYGGGIAPINLLLDEGRETLSGTYTCALTPMTIVSQTPFKVRATLDLDGWTAQQVNDLSFGVTYAAAGNGVVQVDAVRAWLDYSGSFGDALPSKRPLGLSSVAVSRTGRRVAVGVGGKILYSDNGTAWIPAVSGTLASLLDVAWDGRANHFVVVGRGVILVGDGVTWAKVSAGIPETLWTVEFNRLTRALIAFGDGGVQASPDDAGIWLTRYR